MKRDAEALEIIDTLDDKVNLLQNLHLLYHQPKSTKNDLLLL
jgi:hypothetical protein